MIKVQVKELPRGSGFQAVTNAALNGMAHQYKDHLSKALASFKCANHCSTSTVTIAFKMNNLEVQKTSFCCQEFSDSIKFETKK